VLSVIYYRRPNRQILRVRVLILDLENGFFHVSVAEDSRKYTAFIMPNAHYEFLRMAFGLSTSLAYFQRYIKER